MIGQRKRLRETAGWGCWTEGEGDWSGWWGVVWLWEWEGCRLVKGFGGLRGGYVNLANLVSRELLVCLIQKCLDDFRRKCLNFILFFYFYIYFFYNFFLKKFILDKRWIRETKKKDGGERQIKHRDEGHGGKRERLRREISENLIKKKDLL